MKKEMWAKALRTNKASAQIFAHQGKNLIWFPVLTKCGNVIALGGNSDVLAAWIITLDKNKILTFGTSGHVIPRFLIKRDDRGYCTIRIDDKIYNYNIFRTNIELLKWFDTFESLNYREIEIVNNQIKFGDITI